MARIAEKPLDWDAVAAADDAFYAAHPEFVKNGVRVPLDPCDPLQAELRDEWMDRYEEAGGDVYYGKHTPNCDHPVEPCDEPAELMVHVIGENGDPVPEALVELVAGTAGGTTSAEGWVDLGTVSAPSAWTVRVMKEGYDTEWGVGDVMPNETHVIEVILYRAEGPDPVPPPPKPPQKRKGHKSKTCEKACEDDPEIAEILEGILTWRDIAFGMGLYGAVAALNHYLQASGRFVEIPMDFAEKVRDDSWPSHRAKSEKALKGTLSLGIVNTPGVRGSLAEHLVDIVPTADPANPIVALLPPEDWPSEVTVTLAFASGEEGSALDHFLDMDETVTYYGSTLRSEFGVRCRRTNFSDAWPSYICEVRTWETYVVDNYDWEGDKELGFNKVAPGFPDQSEMRRLGEVGCARPYQRSSRFWIPKDLDGPNRIRAWVEKFESEDDITAAAIRRHFADKSARKLPKGALPIPGPADEM